jgi:ABC-type sugar transport system permease subunit
MYQRERKKLIIPFLLPALLLYLTLVILPMGLTIFFSFTKWSGQSPDRPFAGLLNYQLMTLDPFVLIAAKNSVLFSVIGALVVFPVALFLGWALTQVHRFRSALRYIVVSPLILSIVTVSLLWRLLYNPVFGPIDSFLKLVGLKSLALPWLGDPSTALVAVVIMASWHQLGQWVLFICAGIERVPVEIQEAARVDGANEWRVFWTVTLPMLWGVLRQLFILWIVYSLKVFAEFFIMLPGGGVANSGEVMGTLIYSRAFTSYQFGFACALATSLMVTIFVTTTLVNRFTKRDVVEF